MNYQTQAIILKSWKAKNFDRVYEIFSREHGKITVLGKGVRKSKARLASGMEPITYSRVYLFKGRKMDRLVGILILEQFLNIKKKLKLLVEVQRTTQILRSFINDNEKNERVFNFYLKYLKNINKSKKSDSVQTLFFIWSLINEGGYQHQLVNCIRCGEKLKSKNKYFFSFKKGVVCEKCSSREAEKVKISEEEIKILRIIKKRDLFLLSKIKIEKELISQLFFITRNVLENILDRKIYL